MYMGACVVAGVYPWLPWLPIIICQLEVRTCGCHVSTAVSRGHLAIN